MKKTINDYLSLLLAEGIVVERYIEDGDQEIGMLSCNSAENQQDGLFVCKGEAFKSAYLLDAVKKGAVCYVSEKPYDEAEVSYIIVDDIRRAMALLANAFYGEAWRDMKIIGLTGTKGKSTTAFMVKAILDAASEKETAVLSSITNYDGLIREESHLTTPETIDLHRHFQHAEECGIKYLTMEVSSQALKYERVGGVQFDVAGFLNIGTDHISPREHRDFEDYFSSKLKIFENSRVACVNLDSDYPDRILAAARKTDKVITFGKSENADIQAKELFPDASGITMHVKAFGCEEIYRVNMPGLFNAENALCAIAVAKALGVEDASIRKGLEKAHADGRMEAFCGKNSRGEKVDVLVDYAHNKMSFETLFKDTQARYRGKKKAAVFGCPGGKAYARRKELPEIAGKYADLIVVTEEDAGSEDVDAISREIAGNVPEGLCRTIIENDRAEAIKKAIDFAHEGDLVVITGKGRETRQKRGNTYVPVMSDVAVVEAYFAQNAEK